MPAGRIVITGHEDVARVRRPVPAAITTIVGHVAARRLRSGHHTPPPTVLNQLRHGGSYIDQRQRPTHRLASEHDPANAHRRAREALR
jgi:hypothetical protein